MIPWSRENRACGQGSIHNDPDDWVREHNGPRYIVDLLKRVVRGSMETMKIVATLPGLNERK